MFKNSINAINGIIKNIDKKNIKFGIVYYDTMYRKNIYINYSNKQKRNIDFDKIKCKQFTYNKIN